jgi:hypothetical protein
MKRKSMFGAFRSSLALTFDCDPAIGEENQVSASRFARLDLTPQGFGR